MIKCVYNEQIVEDLDKKMVFLSGPRQAGKTTLARGLKSTWTRLEYLNYDSIKDREIFLNESWDRRNDLLILDEIHKHKGWKNRVKGIYDTEGNRPRILVTGSARLNIYRKSGDSLAGRFFHHRLYPLTYKEVVPFSDNPKNIVSDFLLLGNFPEPFLSQSEKDSKRWRKDYVSLVTTQDAMRFADIKDINSLQLMIDMLRTRVGSPVSMNSLARDLQISPNTVKRYI